MISKENLIKSRDPSWLQNLSERAIHAGSNQEVLDERTVMAVIQHFALIMEVGRYHYLSFASPDMARSVLDSLRHRRPEYLAVGSRQSPVFNNADNSYRINITGDYFASLAHADGTDLRIVLRIKTPRESKAIAMACLRRLERDQAIEIYDSCKDLIHDMLQNGLFGIVDNSRAGVYIADDAIGNKIYAGLWMYAPELLHDSNYGNGLTRQPTARGSFQEIQLSLAATQQLLAKYPIENQKIINDGNSIHDDKQSIADAIVKHLSIKNAEKLSSGNTAIENFLKPASQRGGSNGSVSTLINPDEVLQYIQVPLPGTSNVIDAAHLFKRSLPNAVTPAQEVEELFPKHPPAVSAPRHRQENTPPFSPPVSAPAHVLKSSEAKATLSPNADIPAVVPTREQLAAFQEMLAHIVQAYHAYEIKRRQSAAKPLECTAAEAVEAFTDAVNRKLAGKHPQWDGKNRRLNKLLGKTEPGEATGTPTEQEVQAIRAVLSDKSIPLSKPYDGTSYKNITEQIQLTCRDEKSALSTDALQNLYKSRGLSDFECAALLAMGNRNQPQAVATTPKASRPFSGLLRHSVGRYIEVYVGKYCDKYGGTVKNSLRDTSITRRARNKFINAVNEKLEELKGHPRWDDRGQRLDELLGEKDDATEAERRLTEQEVLAIRHVLEEENIKWSAAENANIVQPSQLTYSSLSGGDQTILSPEEFDKRCGDLKLSKFQKAALAAMGEEA